MMLPPAEASSTTFESSSSVEIRNDMVSNDDEEYELVPHVLEMPENDNAETHEESSSVPKLATKLETTRAPPMNKDDEGLSPEVLLKYGEKDPKFAMKLLGTRVELKWSSGRWYRGTICEYNENHKKHHVVYDDGDERWYHLSEMIFRFVKDEEEWVKC